MLQELDGTLTTLNYAKGKLSFLEATSILSPDFRGAIAAADIHISPDGGFLYATNRGDANTIPIFKILKNGKLESKGQTSSLGKGPRYKYTTRYIKIYILLLDLNYIVQ